MNSTIKIASSVGKEDERPQVKLYYTFSCFMTILIASSPMITLVSDGQQVFISLLNTLKQIAEIPGSHWLLQGAKMISEYCKSLGKELFAPFYTKTVEILVTQFNCNTKLSFKRDLLLTHTDLVQTLIGKLSLPGVQRLLALLVGQLTSSDTQTVKVASETVILLCSCSQADITQHCTQMLLDKLVAL